MTIQVLASSTGAATQYKLGASTDGLVLAGASIVATNNFAIGLQSTGQSLNVYGAVFGLKGLELGFDTTVATSDVVSVGAGGSIGGSDYGIVAIGGSNKSLIRN